MASNEPIGPLNYRIFPCSCRNCKHVFRWSEHDMEDQLLCTLGAPPRPLCGSVRLGEVIGPDDEEAADAWYEWCEDRRVVKYALCDHWAMKMAQDG